MRTGNYKTRIQAEGYCFFSVAVQLSVLDFFVFSFVISETKKLLIVFVINILPYRAGTNDGISETYLIVTDGFGAFDEMNLSCNTMFDFC